jgi:hypothetical protein
MASAVFLSTTCSDNRTERSVEKQQLIPWTVISRANTGICTCYVPANNYVDNGSQNWCELLEAVLMKKS